MAMIPSDYNPYSDSFNDYSRPPRSREEYEYMMNKRQMYEMQAARPTQAAPEAPKKPSHLNPKLLLIKGA